MAVVDSDGRVMSSLNKGRQSTSAVCDAKCAGGLRITIMKAGVIRSWGSDDGMTKVLVSRDVSVWQVASKTKMLL